MGSIGWKGGLRAVGIQKSGKLERKKKDQTGTARVNRELSNRLERGESRTHFGARAGKAAEKGDDH